MGRHDKTDCDSLIIDVRHKVSLSFSGILVAHIPSDAMWKAINKSFFLTGVEHGQNSLHWTNVPKALDVLKEAVGKGSFQSVSVPDKTFDNRDNELFHIHNWDATRHFQKLLIDNPIILEYIETQLSLRFSKSSYLIILSLVLNSNIGQPGMHRT